MGSERLTLMLINAANIMVRADESLLPAVYKEVGDTLHTDPTGLGTLTLFRSIVQSLCYPLAAYLVALRHNRAHVIALGAFLWAAATFLVAVSTTFSQVAISRGLNGIGLAIVSPAINSLIADLTEDDNRGIAFGWLQFTGNVGAVIGSFFSILLASTSFMGIAGWRIAFHLVALVSVLVGILVRLYAHDPHFNDSDANVKSQSSEIKLTELITEAKKVIGIPSFQVIVAQGVSGSFAGSAYSFIPMWLELIGFSHKTTGFLWTIFIVGFSIGGLFGGKMGDKLAKILPNSGRIILSQISAGSAIFLTAILLLVLPDDPSSAFMHGIVFLIMGLCTSWNAPATNNPIFAEIVPERSRTSIYALDQSFENILASFAPPLVGVLAQHVYGYKPIPKGSTNSQEIATDRKNAAVLAKALYTAIGIPFTVCCIVYSFLYCTYPRDRERARMDALIESEMVHMENNDILPAEEKYLQVEILKSDQKLDDYQGHGSLDFDENDEKRLISH